MNESLISGLSATVTVVFMVVVYRHAVGAKRVNTLLLVVMFILSLFPCCIAYLLGYVVKNIKK